MASHEKSTATQLPQETETPKPNIPPGMRDPAQRIIHNPITKVTAEFIKYGAETNNEYTHIRFTLHPNGTALPPRHYCRTFNETITAHDFVCAHVGPKKQPPRILEPGEELVVNAYEPHAWSNPLSNKDVSYEVVVRPARVEFEQMLYFISGLARDGGLNAEATPKSLLTGCTLVVGAGVRPCGKRWVMLEPVIRVMGWLGKVRGKKEELEKLYWNQESEDSVGS
jgi:hypothetical protein